MLTYSIIVCTYNRDSFLEETIKSILLHFSNKTNFELLIIDNNSTDTTAQLVKPFLSKPQVRYFLETNQGLSHARNRGIQEAGNDILVFLDDDIDIEANYLDVCDDVYSNPDVQIVGGKVLPYRVSVPNWLPEKFFYLASIFDLGDITHYSNKLMGANYTMRKAVAEKVGLYNVELGRKGNSLMGGEENDYFNRAHALGYRVMYNPNLIVYHKINNKLNKDYIFSYSRQNGKSEGLIDYKLNKYRFMGKIIKSILMIGLFYVYGAYISDPKQQTYYKINQLYSLGYLSVLSDK